MARHGESTDQMHQQIPVDAARCCEVIRPHSDYGMQLVATDVALFKEGSCGPRSPCGVESRKHRDTIFASILVHEHDCCLLLSALYGVRDLDQLVVARPDDADGLAASLVDASVNQYVRSYDRGRRSPLCWLPAGHDHIPYMAKRVLADRFYECKQCCFDVGTGEPMRKRLSGDPNYMFEVDGFLGPINVKFLKVWNSRVLTNQTFDRECDNATTHRRAHGQSTWSDAEALARVMGNVATSTCT